MKNINQIYSERLSNKLLSMPINERNNLIKETINITSFWENEISSKAEVIKNKGKIINEEIENYERFKSWCFIEYLSYKKGLNGGFFAAEKNRVDKILKEAYSNGEINEDQVYQIMSITDLGLMTDFFNKNGKLLQINKEIFNLLCETDVKIDYEEIPFNQIFIQTNDFIIDHVDIFGVLLRKRIIDEVSLSLEEINDKKPNEVIEIIIIGIDLKDNENIWFNDTIFKNYKILKNIEKKNKYYHKYSYYNSWCSKELDKKIREEIKKLCVNTLNLINHPDVEIINHSKKELRENRIRKGKLGMPDSIEINLTGKLKRYVYQELPKQKESANNYSHKFWVRGHWMNFTSPRYINMKGKKKWVLPYIKGRGELISKDYYLGEKEKCWENEKRMKKIIQSIFPDKKIINNTRTELKGLEIDCYIPELKLGFEYNGEQHYNHIEIFHKTKEEFEAQKQRDIEKNELAEKKGIKLITIRYDEPLTEELILNKINGNENGKKN